MEERIVDNGPVSLATRAWLQADGPCVVLVHGLGHNVEIWGALVPLLREWCTVVAFDRRGHGGSFDARSYTANELADDIAAVIEGYSVVDPILVGHSIGAWDCLTYATRSPARAVICVDQAIASDDPVWHESLGNYSDATEHGYSDAELAERLARGETAIGAHLWRTVYGPMNRRALVRYRDGLLHYRPDAATLRHIRSDRSSFIANGEPYDKIACPITIVLAQRNTGPIHDALERLVARRNLESVNVDRTTMCMSTSRS